MKTIILCGFVLFGLSLLGDESTPVTNSAGASAVPAQVTEKARALEIRDSLRVIGATGDADKATWQAVAAEIDSYQKDFGVTQATTNNVILLRKFELAVAKKFPDSTRYNALLQQLVADPVPPVAEMAQQQSDTQKGVEGLQAKPIDLKFTALDGSAVDLAKMRGKVVLIDFWATWCPDCITGVPEIVSVYQKYHGLGFEVVGVSLDKDKAALLDFTRQNGMVWPQYFDGKQWDNAISNKLDISVIPALWLFDKKGLLVTKNGRDDLAGQVAQLLKKP